MNSELFCGSNWFLYLRLGVVRCYDIQILQKVRAHSVCWHAHPKIFKWSSCVKREEQLAPVSARAVSEARGEVLPKFMRAALAAPERNAPTDRSPL